MQLMLSPQPFRGSKYGVRLQKPNQNTTAIRPIRPAPRPQTVHITSAKLSTKPQTLSVDKAINVLHKATQDGTGVPAREVLDALLALDKAKPKVDWENVIPGPGSQKQRWQLQYTASGKDITAANKGQYTKGGAYWAILPAAIGFAEDGGHENGVYLGHVASMRLNGRWSITSNKIGFGYENVVFKVGPWALPFTVKKDLPKVFANPAKAPGMFVLVYADDMVMAARGKSGGIALWRKASSTWQLKAGVYS